MALPYIGHNIGVCAANVSGSVRLYLRGVQGVGEDGADRPLSRRQAGIFPGMFVFLCHLGGTWKSTRDKKC